MQAVLTCQGVSKMYHQKYALQDLDLVLPPGKIIGLLGPNGSGKTTLIKLISGVLTPNAGQILVDGVPVGHQTKSLVSYLPERTYLNDWMRIRDIIRFFSDFYQDFQPERAYDMLKRLQIDPSDRLKTLSKGTKEKVQLILVMSRQAKLYLLDEPIGGVDPAARDYILNTIIQNYQEDATVLISTHLITDIERVLDEVVFLQNGKITLQGSVDSLREEHQASIDELFREVFRC